VEQREFEHEGGVDFDSVLMTKGVFHFPYKDLPGLLRESFRIQEPNVDDGTGADAGGKG